jgi:hypothetical protein
MANFQRPDSLELGELMKAMKPEALVFKSEAPAIQNLD